MQSWRIWKTANVLRLRLPVSYLTAVGGHLLVLDQNEGFSIRSVPATGTWTVSITVDRKDAY